jgi:metallophosphoesterase superfamily enzyme
MLTDVIARWRPEVLVILGDLFHSDLNNEWLDFEAWLHRHRTLSVVLVKGNHDILPEAVYQHPNLAVHPEAWAVDPFLLTHEPVVEAVQRRGGLSFPPTASVSRYNLAGHIHPGVYVGAGMGERVKLPCFYFTSQLGILPAFGQFTGCATVRPQPDDQVFAVVSPQRVLAIRQ